MYTLKTIPPDTLVGCYVRVYRNLHNGLFSVQHKGRVIAHLAELTLENVNFSVQPKGHAKVLATQTKSVHAFVTGTVAPELIPLSSRAYYNPYRSASFLDATGDALYSAPVVTLQGGRIYL